MDPLLEVVKKYWDYDTLRPLQREATTAAVDGRDSLVVLPTGGGKSLCYQVPALLSDKLTVVVSPLIALMQDQVDALLSKGLPATFINSTLSDAERLDRQRRMRAGDFKLVYVAPERFRSEAFVSALQEAHVALYAIDEAHCISQWGHDFRPDYLRLGDLLAGLDARIIAMTATASATWVLISPLDE